MRVESDRTDYLQALGIVCHHNRCWSIEVDRRGLAAEFDCSEVQELAGRHISKANHRAKLDQRLEQLVLTAGALVDKAADDLAARAAAWRERTGRSVRA